MDALLSSLVAAALAEWGDRTQLLVILLAARYRRAAPILVGLAVAALANALIAAAGGVYVHDLVPPRAGALLVALALILAGFGGLVTRRPPRWSERLKGGAFFAALVGAFLLELGDKTQFITFALAARFDSLALTAAGATLGIVASNIPAAVLAERLVDAVPTRPVRIAVALLFLVTGFVVAVGALDLT